MATHVLTGVPAASPPPNSTLRVCHVIGADLWAGAETQVVSTMSYLVEQPGIALTAVLFNDGRLADELRHLGVGVVILDETRTSTLGIFLGLVRVLRAHRFDLVHLHKYKDGVLGSIAARIAGVPCIVRTMHGLAEPLLGWEQIKARVYDTLDRITLQCLADLVIAVSQRMTETLWESGYQPRMVTCIRNGLDLQHVTTTRQPQDVRRELGIEPRALLIGTVGRLSAIKGQVHLLGAAKRVIASQPWARFLFVGDGPLRNELLITAAELHLAASCVFPGARHDVYDVVSAMDIFTLPSLNEGIPMSLLEAMALGRPVVASAVGGIPEVIQDRVNGRLVPPGDEAALADACLELATDRELARTMGERARQTIEDSFSHERCGSALLNVYQSVASTSERRMRQQS
jgi:glycosyltransferase involved in cell wall biosynthesis